MKVLVSPAPPLAGSGSPASRPFLDPTNASRYPSVGFDPLPVGRRPVGRPREPRETSLHADVEAEAPPHQRLGSGNIGREPFTVSTGRGGSHSTPVLRVESPTTLLVPSQSVVGKRGRWPSDRQKRREGGGDVHLVNGLTLSDPEG